MISLLLPATDDVAELVEALLAAADTRDTRAPAQAARWRDLANELGDALDQLPRPAHSPEEYL